MAADPPGPAKTPGEGETDVPPPLGTWNRIYALVLGALAVHTALDLRAPRRPVPPIA